MPAELSDSDLLLRSSGQPVLHLDLVRVVELGVGSDRAHPTPVHQAEVGMAPTHQHLDHDPPILGKPPFPILPTEQLSISAQ